MLNASQYADTYSLPHTRAQVRRALVNRYSHNEFHKNSVRLVGDTIKIVFRRTLPEYQHIQLERLLTLYYLQVKDTKQFFKLLYSL